MGDVRVAKPESMQQSRDMYGMLHVGNNQTCHCPILTYLETVQEYDRAMELKYRVDLARCFIITTTCSHGSFATVNADVTADELMQLMNHV